MNIIHINSHFAIGVIITSIAHSFFHFTWLDFLLIVFLSFLNDWDIFFSKYAKDHNHRNLISHSIIPSLCIIVLGFVINWPALIIGGIGYFIHICVDTFDWGTNFFYFPKKTVGLRFLIRKEEKELPKYLAQYKVPESFFDLKYYNNKVTIALEIILFALMMLFLILYALEFIWVIVFYFLGLTFHLSRHFHLKKVESSKNTQ